MKNVVAIAVLVGAFVVIGFLWYRASQPPRQKSNDEVFAELRYDHSEKIVDYWRGLEVNKSYILRMKDGKNENVTIAMLDPELDSAVISYPKDGAKNIIKVKLSGLRSLLAETNTLD